jgi:uncharacterized lipoprotein YmbA
LVVLVLVMASLVACSLGGKTPPSKFYVLSPGPAAPLDSGSSLSVLLGPLSLPDVVLRPQITTRPEPGRVVFAEFHRWAGDLRANVEQVLLQNLSDRLGSSMVIPLGSRVVDTDYRVSIRFQRFDGALGRSVALQGSWRLKAGTPGCLVGVYRFAIETPLHGGDYGAYIRGLDGALALLSDRIAQTLARRPRCPAL